MNHPRTKILSSIWSLKKELNLIDGIRYFQQIHLQDFCSILHPNSFLAPPPSRRFLFQVEEPFLQKQIERLERSRFHLQDLDFRLRDESNHVSTMLMVREESKGNAIIVFTIVTIIFLPLSWATSYLGMNTSDIRDLRQGQWLYWSIAAPVTCLVIGIAALVAMKGDEIREFFIRREGFRYQKKEEKAKRLVRQGTALSMVPQPRWKEMWSSFRERRRERREHDRV